MILIIMEEGLPDSTLILNKAQVSY